MPIDYSKIPTSDLENLKAGQLTRVSTKTLQYLRSESGETAPAASKQRPAEVRQGPAKWKKKASELYTPILEGVGAGLGAVTGAAAGAPTGPGAVLSSTFGAGLGYATGKRIASMGDELLGIGHSAPQPRTAGEMTYAAAKDVLTGANMEAGGQVIGHAGGAALNKLAKWRREGRPLSNELARTRAGEFLTERTTPANAVDAASRKRNKLATTQLRSRTGVDRPSLAQESGGMNIAATEQAYASQDPAVFGQATATRDAEIAGQARKHVADTIPGQRGGETIANKVQSYAAGLETNAKVAQHAADAQTTKLAAPTDSQTLGENIVTSIQKAREPFTKATRKAYDDLPQYEIPTANFDKTTAEIVGTPMYQDTEEVVKKVLGYAEKVPRNTAGLQKLDGTIGSIIREQGTSNDARRVLRQLQGALREDFDAMGTAAEKGDVAIHDGKLVIPSKLQSEVADLEKRIAAEKGKQAGVDVDAVRKALQEAGDSSAMKVTGEKPAQYAERIAKQYQRRFPNQPVPTVATTDAKQLAEWEQGVATRKAQLESLQPAEDVAAKYSAARKTARTEFDKFTRGPLEKIFKDGNTATGRAVSNEDVARHFASPTGADHLIEAVGQKQAATLMRDHFAVEANTLLDRPPAQLAKWVKKNAAVLQKYGLHDEFSSLAKVRTTVAESKVALERFNKSVVAKVLGAEPEKAIEYALGTKNPERVMRELKAFDKGDKQYLDGLKVALRDHILKATEVTARDAMGAHKASLAKTDRLIGDRFDRAMKVIYSPKEIQALKDYASVTEMLSRNKNVSASGGSTTVEKAMGGIQTGTLFDRISNAGRYTHISGGWVSSIKNVLIGALKGVKDEHVGLIDRYVKEALVDPSKAEALMKLVKDNKSKAAAAQIKAELRGMAIGAAGRAGAVQVMSEGGGEEEDQWGDPTEDDN